MPRTVIPETKPVPQSARTRSAGGDGDDYLTKLAKYAPAEAMAVFVPAAAFAGVKTSWLVLTFFVSAGVGLGALVVAGRKAKASNPAEAPYLHFYLLSMLAFVFWAFGVNAALQAFVGVSAEFAGFLLLLVAAVIPIADALLNPGAAKRRQEAADRVAHQRDTGAAAGSATQPPMDTSSGGQVS